MGSIGGAIGKTTEIAQVLPKSLSAGKIAVIVVCIAVVVIGGIAWCVYRKERKSNSDEDDEEPSCFSELRAKIGRSMRRRGNKGEVLEEGEKLAPDKEDRPDPGDWDAETARGAGYGDVEGKKELPWDEKYLPIAASSSEVNHPHR